VSSDIAIRFGQNLKRCRHRAGSPRNSSPISPASIAPRSRKFERGENQPMLENARQSGLRFE